MMLERFRPHVNPPVKKAEEIAESVKENRGREKESTG